MKAAPATGEINLGSPDDLLHPHVPKVMRDFARSHPKVKVNLHSAQTVFLKERLARGELDVILTTEPDLYPGGETLAARPLVWIGAPGGQAWKRRPFPLGTVAGCIFNKPAIESLSAAGFDWTVAVNSVSNPVMDANLAADRVVRLQMQGSVNLQVEEIRHGGALPRLPDFYVNMYLTQGPRRRLAEPLAEALRGDLRRVPPHVPRNKPPPHRRQLKRTPLLGRHARASRVYPRCALCCTSRPGRLV